MGTALKFNGFLFIKVNSIKRDAHKFFLQKWLNNKINLFLKNTIKRLNTKAQYYAYHSYYITAYC